jgi:hypothetical protein
VSEQNRTNRTALPARHWHCAETNKNNEITQFKAQSLVSRKLKKEEVRCTLHPSEQKRKGSSSARPQISQLYGEAAAFPAAAPAPRGCGRSLRKRTLALLMT